LAVPLKGPSFWGREMSQSMGCCCEERETWHTSTLFTLLTGIRLWLTPSLKALWILSAYVSHGDDRLYCMLPRPKDRPFHPPPLFVMKFVHCTLPTTITQAITIARNAHDLLGIVWSFTETIHVVLEHQDAARVCVPSNSTDLRRSRWSFPRSHSTVAAARPSSTVNSWTARTRCPFVWDNGFGETEMRTGKQRIDCCVLGRAGGLFIGFGAGRHELYSPRGSAMSTSRHVRPVTLYYRSGPLRGVLADKACGNIEHRGRTALDQVCPGPRLIGPLHTRYEVD